MNDFNETIDIVTKRFLSKLVSDLSFRNDVFNGAPIVIVWERWVTDVYRSQGQLYRLSKNRQLLFQR